MLFLDGVVMTGLLPFTAFISMPGGGEWIVILIIGLLIFGRRLPDVARSLGKSVNEFKKGMREFQDSADEVARDVNKMTNEVASDVKTASGMNDYGYQEPTASTYDAGQYSPSESTPAATSDASQDSAPQAQAVETTSSVAEGGTAAVAETSAKTEEQDPHVESPK